MSLPLSYLDFNPKHYRPLTEDESRVFVTLTLAKDYTVPATKLAESMTDLFTEPFINSFLVQVMIKRLIATRSDLEYSPLLIGFLAVISDRVGIAVHWAYTAMAYNRKGGKPMTMKAWTQCFPLGPPNEEEQHRLWLTQKTKEGANAIDGREAWAKKYSELS